jgi:apolipoprotein N-acyltransferase
MSLAPGFSHGPSHWPARAQAALAGNGSLLLALLAGALLSLAFAPFGAWPLTILCPAVLMALWQHATPRRAAALGLAFGAGTYAAGTWWLYISIHVFGQAPVWLTLFLMIAMVALMAVWQGLLGYAIARWLPADGCWRWFAGLPAAWLLVEWWRGWFISGFPWLSLGYAHSDTLLRHWAPLAGVYGISGLCLLQAGALLALWRGARAARLAALAVFALAWGGGAAVGRVPWTHPVGAPVAVAIVQGAIPQDEKWLADHRDSTRQRYRELNEQTGGAKLVVWPESAIPELANEIVPYLSAIQASSVARGAEVLMGVVRVADNGEDYYNSIMSLGGELAFYDKRHLVPFAEYFPVPGFVRSWLRLMSLPYADFTAGSARQQPMRAAGLRIAPTICYEDAFGGAQRGLVRDADLLINVTNDAWFGHSPARYQHLQIGRLRALESQRYLVRAANDGVSALVGPDGQVLATAPEYQPAVLHGTVQGRRGLSPYTVTGDGPLLLLGLLAAAAAVLRGRSGRLKSA